MFITGPGDHQDGHRRGRHVRRTRRRDTRTPRAAASPTSSLRTKTNSSTDARASLVLPAEQPRGSAALRCDDDPNRLVDGARRSHPRLAEQAVRHARGDRRRSSTTATSSRFRRSTRRTSSAASGASNGRSVGVVANQPSVLAGVLDIALVDQRRAVRALLRCVQHPARHVRRRARFLAGNRSGVRRHHPARCEAALCVRRGDRSEDHGHHAQGLRRRVRRHGRASTSAPTSTWRGRPRRSR